MRRKGNSGQKLLPLVRKTAGATSILENYSLRIGVFLIAVLVGLEALLRYTMRAMPLGLEEAALTVAAWVYFLGIAVAMRGRKQITVSLLKIFPIPPCVLKRIDIITVFLTFVICGIFAYFAIVWCYHVHTAHMRLPPFKLSALVSYLSLATGLTLATVYSLIQLVRKLRGR